MVLCGCAGSQSVNVEADPAILRVGVTPDAPPLIHKQGETITGLEAEMATQLSAYLQKEAVFVELAWEDQIPALMGNRIDIIMSGMSVTLAREYDIAFASPYFKSGLMILVKDLHKFAFIKNVQTAFAQSITWRIGVIAGTTGENLIRRKSTGAKAIRTFSNQDKALDALKAGRIDVFVHDAPMILQLAARNQSEGIKPLPIMLNEEYLAWGIRKDDLELIQSANAFIDQATQAGTLQATIQRWIPLAK
jgi:polar amino acid transport system substrate-binding protein